jgi:hypothetical protein
MKQQLLVGAISCVLTLVITLGFRAITDRFLQDKGRVVVGRPITISGIIFTEFQIENWSSKPLDNLIIVVPNSTSISLIVASTPISVEELQGVSVSQSLKRLSISGISAHHITRVLIPMSSAGDRADLFLPNIEQLDLQAEWGDYAESPTAMEWSRAIWASVSYALFAGAMMFFALKWPR